MLLEPNEEAQELESRLCQNDAVDKKAIVFHLQPRLSLILRPSLFRMTQLVPPHAQREGEGEGTQFLYSVREFKGGDARARERRLAATLEFNKCTKICPCLYLTL